MGGVRFEPSIPFGHGQPSDKVFPHNSPRGHVARVNAKRLRWKAKQGMLDDASPRLTVNNFSSFDLKAAPGRSRLDDADSAQKMEHAGIEKVLSDLRREQHERCYPPVSESDKVEHKRERKIV
jgi:hypothetical protein